MAKTKNFIDAIRAKLAADPELAGLVEEAAVNSDIAIQVRALREASKLTQKELAQKIGTQQSVISRVEDAEYEGRSVSLLLRVAAALGKKVCIKLCSEEEKRRLLFASTNSEARIVVRATPPAIPAAILGSNVYVYGTSAQMPDVKVRAVGNRLAIAGS